jgi:hypothetical protein
MVNANDKVDRPPLEKDLMEIGFKSVEEALDDCEAHFNKNIELPYKLPPVAFTHYMGRCTQDLGVNNGFEVDYINENSTHSPYRIRLRPKNHRIKFKKEHIEQTYNLKSGKALLLTEPVNGFNLLVFERDGWQYILSIDKRESKEVSPKVLVEIANSFR